MNGDLFHLLRSIGGLLPVGLIRWPSDTPGCAIQAYLIDNIILNTHLQLYPPSTDYQRTFWKFVITKLEESQEEVDEIIYRRYLDLISNSSKRLNTSILCPPLPSYITQWWMIPTNGLHIGSGPQEYYSTTLLESRTTIERGTTGLRTWPASYAMAQYIIKRADLVLRSVLELGSGTGFLGMIIAKLQLVAIRAGGHRTPSLWLTDVDADVLQRCQSNVSLPCNGLQSHKCIHVSSLDWSLALQKPRAEPLSSLLKEADPELLIGCDLLYDPSIIPALVETLHVFLSTPLSEDNSAREAYIALAVRNEATVAAFLHEAATVLHVEERKICTDNYEGFINNFETEARGNDKECIKLFRFTYIPNVVQHIPQ